MNYPDIALLNQRFGAPGRIAFRSGEAGLPVVSLVNRFGACEVSLYGGHVLGYRPVGLGPVLFVSQHSFFEPGKPIRGGIPICWPWFGPNPDDPAKPLHGFARILQWDLRATEYSSDVTELRLSLTDSDLTRRYWPFAFELTLRVWLDERLNLELATENRDTRPFTLTQAFHPYFLVRDIREVTVHGLDGAAYADRLASQPGKHEGPLTIRAETDRLFSPPEPKVALLDAGLKRALAMTFAGTSKMMVWNPWVDKARALPDFGDDEYTRMLCLEPANAADAAVALAPGGRHALSLSLQATLA
jgi:glucose-6-phosphate 1-epimerase